MARWEEVFDAQVDLFKGLTDGLQRLQVDGFLQSVNERRTIWQENYMPERLRGMVFNADPVYVEPEMMTIWEASLKTFQPEPLRAEDFVTPAGFLLFPRPVWLEDIRGKMTSYRALLWHPCDFHIRGTLGPSKQDGREVLRPSEVRMPVRKGLSPDDGESYDGQGVLLSLWHHTRDFDDVGEGIDRSLPPMLVLAHLMPWTFGSEWELVEDKRSIVRPVQALWRLMQQTIADIAQASPPKPFRKRWAKASLPEKRVTVVRLRRPEHHPDTEPEHRHVDWAHRWLVGGHWRNQYYSSLGIHRQIWISPYVKGPEDKELIVNKVRVFELVR